VLGRQMRGSVGLVPYAVVTRGAGAIADEFARLRADGTRCAIADALADEHLRAIGSACAELPLVTGGSGVATALPENFRRAGLLPARREVEPLPRTDGHSAVLAGSCSPATLAQVDAMKRRLPWYRLDAVNLARDGLVAEVLEWAAPRLLEGPVLIYSSAAPEDVAVLQARLGAHRAGALIENVFAEIAEGLVRLGAGRLVVAGGETSGAVVSALGIRALRIGPEIAPGVPWTVCEGTERPLCLALKSGNFGAEDFFLRALAMA
jgi:3-dehydrotetronate 4-kinase